MAQLYAVPEIPRAVREASKILSVAERSLRAVERQANQFRRMGTAESTIETAVNASLTIIKTQIEDARTKLDTGGSGVVPSWIHTPQVVVGRPPLFDTCRFAVLDEEGGTLLWGPANDPSTDVFAVFDDGDIVQVSGSSNSGNNKGYTVEKPVPTDINIVRNPALRVEETAGNGNPKPKYWFIETTDNWEDPSNGAPTLPWARTGFTVGSLFSHTLRRVMDEGLSSGSGKFIYQKNEDMPVPLIDGVTYEVGFTVSNRTAGSVQVFVGSRDGLGTARSTSATFTEDIVAVVNNYEEEPIFGFLPSYDFRGYISGIRITPKSGYTNPLLYLTESGVATVADDRNLRVTLVER